MNGYNFTDGVRKALMLAREEAQRLDHDQVRTEHLLLGILKTDGGVAIAVLQNLGTTASVLITSIEDRVAPGPPSSFPGGGDLPYAARAKKVLELSMSAARNRNDSFVGREHLLLGLLMEEKGVAAQVLAKAGITLDAVEAEIQRVRATSPSDDALATVKRPSTRPDLAARSAAQSAAWSVHLLRHALATLAYRGAKALRGAPAEFATFRIASGSRTPAEILAHMGDLLDWSCSIALGEERWQSVPPGTWDDDIARFHAGLARLDAILMDGAYLRESDQLFQGAIADAFTHVGQLTMLRRLAGSPVRGESYNRADIQRGRLGPDQPPPTREFD